MADIHISFELNGKTGRNDTFLNGEDVEDDIRSMAVAGHVSPIAAVPFVRKAMVVQQQAMGTKKGIVMDGRDIGTTVFPGSRAENLRNGVADGTSWRRYAELKGKGLKVNFNDILKNVEERDYIDTHREVSPLRKADDAIELDNSNMTIEEQREWLLEKFRLATNQHE